MRAIDTNIVVRFLTNDDAAQAARARAVVEEGDLYVPVTVMLETEWVLRTAFGLPTSSIVGRLREFLGLPGVTVENTDLVLIALDWAEQGMDLADAFHLARAEGCATFLSFDRKLARVSAEVGAMPVIAP